MNYRYGYIVNQSGEIVETIAYDPNTLQVKYYELQDGESLVTEKIGDIFMPKWNGNQWIETATQEEIEAIQAEQNAEFEPTEEEKKELQREAQLKAISERQDFQDAVLQELILMTYANEEV